MPTARMEPHAMNRVREFSRTVARTHLAPQLTPLRATCDLIDCGAGFVEFRSRILSVHTMMPRRFPASWTEKESRKLLQYPAK
jgi:hypothetical protein